MDSHEATQKNKRHTQEQLKHTEGNRGSGCKKGSGPLHTSTHYKGRGWEQINTHQEGGEGQKHTQRVIQTRLHQDLHSIFRRQGHHQRPATWVAGEAPSAVAGEAAARGWVTSAQSAVPVASTRRRLLTLGYRRPCSTSDAHTRANRHTRTQTETHTPARTCTETRTCTSIRTCIPERKVSHTHSSHKHTHLEGVGPSIREGTEEDGDAVLALLRGGGHTHTGLQTRAGEQRDAPATVTQCS